MYRIIRMMYFVYQLINHLVFQKWYYYIIFSKLSLVQLYIQLDYIMVTIKQRCSLRIVLFFFIVQYLIDVYQLECGFFMVILYIILTYYARIIKIHDCMTNAMTIEGNVCIVPLHWCLSHTHRLVVCFFFGFLFDDAVNAIDNSSMHFK